MTNMILFTAAAFLLLILLIFLILVIKDHLKSKSFQQYLQESEETRLTHAQHATYSTQTATSEVTEPQQNFKESKAGTMPYKEAVGASAKAQSSPTPSFQEKIKKEQEEQSSRPMAQKESPTLYHLRPSSSTPPTLQKETQTILEKDFGHFNHQRLVEGIGLSPQEADEFVLELIHQLEHAIPELDKAIEEHNFSEVEHITHGLKGAALNIGDGGVAQLLVEYNTYMKQNHQLLIVQAYQTKLKQTVSDLKVEYSQVA